MKKLLIGLSALFVLLLSGCATPYKAHGLMGGFSETRVSENTFQVSFRGNALASRERVVDFTLLRSAELTLQNGYRYFAILNSNNYTRYGSYTTPKTYSTTGNVQMYGNTGYLNTTTTAYGGQTFLYSRPSTMNTIQCFRKKPRIRGIVYDANFIVKSIKTKYKIKPKS